MLQFAAVRIMQEMAIRLSELQPKTKVRVGRIWLYITTSVYNSLVQSLQFKEHPLLGELFEFRFAFSIFFATSSQY